MDTNRHKNRKSDGQSGFSPQDAASGLRSGVRILYDLGSGGFNWVGQQTDFIEFYFLARILLCFYDGKLQCFHPLGMIKSREGMRLRVTKTVLSFCAAAFATLAFHQAAEADLVEYGQSFIADADCVVGLARISIFITTTPR